MLVVGVAIHVKEEWRASWHVDRDRLPDVSERAYKSSKRKAENKRGKIYDVSTCRTLAWGQGLHKYRPGKNRGRCWVRERW